MNLVNIILQLGSNKGDRSLNLQQAMKEIALECTIEHVSSIYETEAWGETVQKDYYNQLIKIHTKLNPYALLAYCQKIENKMGRKREMKWGARIIDLDIIIYGNKIIFSPELIIPHQHMHQRRFILEPLIEFETWIHPIINKSNIMLLKECEDKSQVNRI